MNEREWAYVHKVALSLGGQGGVPPELKNRECRDAIAEMMDGYIQAADLIARQRALEVPLWHRRRIRQQFVERAQETRWRVLAEADRWLADQGEAFA